jgi:hypothetical protein
MQLASITALAGFATATVAHAHHGIANFDLNADIELRGTVARIEFVNPHSWLYINVTDADGATQRWRCELRGATVLRRSGWSEAMFPPGLDITVTGSPDRRDPRTCYLGSALFPDGSSVDRYGQLRQAEHQVAADRPLRLPNGDLNLAGDWASEQRVMTDPRGQRGTLVPISQAEQFEPGDVPAGGQAFPGARGTAISLADDPVDAYWNQRPSMLPLTAAGARAIEGFDGASTDNPRLRCAPTNILFDWTFEQDVNRIEQDESRITLRYGSMGIERTIHLDIGSHPNDLEPSLAGHSIGRWEEDVLVVDTVGFEPGILSADGRLPHSEGLHVVERFILDTGTMTLRREYFAEDPAYFSGRFTGADAVLISDLPYHGTTECEDRTYGASVADDVTADPDASTRTPWWMFWK